VQCRTVTFLSSLFNNVHDKPLNRQLLEHISNLDDNYKQSKDNFVHLPLVMKLYLVRFVLCAPSISLLPIMVHWHALMQHDLECI
jgi:hypothetical protein